MENKPFRATAPISKKSTTGYLTIIDKPAKPLEKSMILHQWPATIQERPKRTWAPAVDTHEGHSGKALEFLGFPVGADWPHLNTHRTLGAPPRKSYN